MSVPDPLGRDRLATGAAMYRPPVYGAKPPPPPFYRRRAFLAAVVVAALVVSFVVYQRSSPAQVTPQTAATRAIQLFLAGDYTRMRRSLCREDRSQVGANDLETAGSNGGQLLKTLDQPRVDRVADIQLTGSYQNVSAKQVFGHITATVGGGTDFTVVTIKEQGGWRVCLSVGGYALSAFALDVPIGGDVVGIS